MSTNHNRIKVADLETNEPNKILKTNVKGELEFSDSINTQNENYNALDCTIEGKALDARQGKVLKEMIDNMPGGVTSVTGIGVNNTDPKNPVIQAASATQTGVINNISLQELGGADKYINGVRIGRGSGNSTTNTAVGANSLTSNTSGSSNTAIGYSTLSLNIGNSKNTAVGYSSLYLNKGDSNTAIGYNSLIGNSSGSSNVAIGISPLSRNSTGSFNIAVGSEAISNNTIGHNNIGLGNNSLNRNTEGYYNIAIGKSAGGNITTGFCNTFITSSPNSPTEIATGNNNTIIGGVSTGFKPDDSYLVVLADGGGNIAIKKEADNRLLAPTLSQSLIISGGPRSLITKEFADNTGAVVNNTTNPLTSNSLSSLYYNALLGFRVHCNNISTGGLIYEKTSAGWLQYSTAMVA